MQLWNVQGAEEDLIYDGKRQVPRMNNGKEPRPQAGAVLR